MPVVTYSRSTDGEKQLSKNFKVREFVCGDGSDSVLIDDDLIQILQNIRDHFGVPVIVNSAYRTHAHNARIKGSPTSQHLYGTAADISLQGVPPLIVCQYAEHILDYRGGVGIYSNFTHVDVRANRSRWDERSGIQVSVSGFPGYGGVKNARNDDDHAHAGQAPSGSKPERTQAESNEPAQIEPTPMEPTPAPKTPVVVYKPDGESTVTLEGFNLQGSVYVQVRALSETLGYTVDWDGKQVTVNKDF